MLVTITDFSNIRGEDRDTVNAFIRNHPEIQKDVSRKGKHTVIDTESEGYSLLEKQYPLPKPTVVVNGVPQEEHDLLRDKYEKLLEAMRELEKTNYERELTQAKIEAKNQAMELLIDEQSSMLKKAEMRAEKEREKVEELNNELMKFNKTVFGLYRKDK